MSAAPVNSTAMGMCARVPLQFSTDIGDAAGLTRAIGNRYAAPDGRPFPAIDESPTACEEHPQPRSASVRYAEWALKSTHRQRRPIYNGPAMASPTRSSDWQRIARLPEFRELLAAKRRFIVPAFVFFCAYYFALPALVGWAPSLMRTRVLGPINLAYLFALSQFFMAWIVAILYTRAAAGFDRIVKELLSKIQKD